MDLIHTYTYTQTDSTDCQWRQLNLEDYSSGEPRREQYKMNVVLDYLSTDTDWTAVYNDEISKKAQEQQYFLLRRNKLTSFLPQSVAVELEWPLVAP